MPSIKVVAEGETFYQHAVALKAAQTMLQAQPDINLIVGADQGATGAESRRAEPAGTSSSSATAAAGRPEGRPSRPLVRHRHAAPGHDGAPRDAVRRLGGPERTRNCGGIDVLKGLPNGGVVTRANVSKFKAEWPG